MNGLFEKSGRLHDMCNHKLVLGGQCLQYVFEIVHVMDNTLEETVLPQSALSRTPHKDQNGV